MPSELLYRIALTMVPQIGCVQARLLLQQFGTAEAVFKTSAALLEKIEGIGALRARAIRRFNLFDRAEKELVFIEKYDIRPLFITDAEYPKRLLHCYDAPLLLYFKGVADLNPSRVLSVIGTRSHSDYGKQLTEQLMATLASLDVLVVSGLAFGIDAIAHKSAMKQSLPTIGVLGHGLSKIYPSEHAQLAREMLDRGGLLTEFASGCKPDKHNFPIRNRIVAGMCDAVVVVETGLKGGSMITAELANGYNKDVFAFPGRVHDPKSTGCNQLIRNNKAVLFTEAAELISLMGWDPSPTVRKIRQREFFPTLSEHEKNILGLLSTRQRMHIDELQQLSNASASATAAAMLNLEMQGIILLQPGKMYALNPA